MMCGPYAKIRIFKYEEELNRITYKIFREENSWMDRVKTFKSTRSPYITHAPVFLKS